MPYNLPLLYVPSRQESDGPPSDVLEGEPTRLELTEPVEGDVFVSTVVSTEESAPPPAADDEDEPNAADDEVHTEITAHE